MTEKNRFDLEQEILECWRVVDDIDVLIDGVCEGNLSNDDIANVLIGLKALYTMKFDRTFKTFEDCIARKEFKEVNFPMEGRAAW